MDWLHAPVCHTPVPDKVHDHFPGFVQYLVNNPVIPDPDPVQRFGTSQFDRIVRERIVRKILDMLKNIREQVLWDFPAVFLHAVFKRKRVRTYRSCSHYALF